MHDDFYDYNEKNDDNMRGCDPASEDDSNDNGMGRWSDNKTKGGGGKYAEWFWPK